MPKVASKTGERLQELTEAAETVCDYIRHFSSRRASIAAPLAVEVADIRKNQCTPTALRALKERNRPVNFKEDELVVVSADVHRRRGQVNPGDQASAVEPRRPRSLERARSHETPP